MRAIYKQVNGQNIMVAHCDDGMVADDNTVMTSNFTFASFPETTQEIREYIDAHSMVTLSLYKVDEVNDQVLLRTPAEMDAVSSASWDYKVRVSG